MKQVEEVWAYKKKKGNNLTLCLKYMNISKCIGLSWGGIASAEVASGQH